MRTIQSYEEFTELAKQDLIILIAKTKTCAVCTPLTDKLIDFMKEYESIPAYQVYLEDVSLFQGQHLVFTVPTILVFSEGREILRESRFIDFAKIKRLFDLFLGI